MERGILMQSESYRILWYFAVYSVLGWCVEVVYCTVKSGIIANRGFLNGPVCPVYGFGMLAVCRVVDLLPLEQMGEASFLMKFITGAVLASAVELIAGWLLFHLFHARWWDYSDRPMNLSGYICLQMSMLWGIGTIVMVDCIHPITQRLTMEVVPQNAGWVILTIFYVLFTADLIVTVSIIVGLNKRLAELDEIRASMRLVSDAVSERLGEDALETQRRIDENRVQAALARAELRDLSEERRKEMEQRLHRQLTSGFFFGPRRLFHAFPDAWHERQGTLWKQLSEEVNGKKKMP